MKNYTSNRRIMRQIRDQIRHATKLEVRRQMRDIVAELREAAEDAAPGTPSADAADTLPAPDSGH